MWSPGIVTRCPLVLKLKKLVNEDKWRGKVSYQDREVEISDPAEVEEEINKGKCPTFVRHRLFGHLATCVKGKGVLSVTVPTLPFLGLSCSPGDPPSCPHLHQAPAPAYFLFFDPHEDQRFGQNLTSASNCLVCK